MADRARYERLRRPAVWIIGLMALVILAGAWHWFRPFLTREELPPTSVPAPPALTALDYFTIATGQEACMSSVTITANSGLAEFMTQPAKPTSKAIQRLELALSAPGYSASATATAPAGRVALQVPITAPRHDTIGSICFVDRGRAAITLFGTNEPRSVTRSPLSVAGKPIIGDITLTFRQAKARSLLDRLGEVFKHASNLTDGLVPIWLIWLIALATGLGVPITLLAAYYLAIGEDGEPAAGG